VTTLWALWNLDVSSTFPITPSQVVVACLCA